MFMSDDQKRDIYLFNNNRRERLLIEASKENTKRAQMEFVVKYFLNKLNANIVAQIDETTESNIKPFKYDYSYLDDYASNDVRRKSVREYKRGRYGVTLPAADVERCGDDKLKVYPTIYALKQGTCVMFASEIARIAHKLNIPCKIVGKLDYCYDKFDGKSLEAKDIKTDRIVKMLHYYNIVTIDGVEYKIDIAGALTAEDLKHYHPDKKIDSKEFIFANPNSKNPISALNSSNAKVLDLSEQQAE